MITRVVFWQNIISPHYAPMFKALSFLPGISVVLVAQAETTSSRQGMGWERPDTGNTIVIVNPSPEERAEILQTEPVTSAHIFSGTRAYPMVWSVFRWALTQSLTIGFLAEPGDWVGLKGKIRLLRGIYDSFILNSKIKYILANGAKAVEWYRKCQYSPDKIFDWAYFVDRPENNVLPDSNESSYKEEVGSHKGSGSPYNIIYIGRLSQEKGVDLLLNALGKISLDFQLTIVGEGPDAEKVNKLIVSNGLQDKVKLHKFVPHKKVFSIIGSSDVLVLPSTGKDGWGAVVNEALLMGTPAIVSSNCGAADLIKSDVRGNVFNPLDEKSLVAILEKRIKNGKTSPETRTAITQWAKRVEGNAGAVYLLSVLNYIAGFSKVKPAAPWISE